MNELVKLIGVVCMKTDNTKQQTAHHNKSTCTQVSQTMAVQKNRLGNCPDDWLKLKKCQIEGTNTYNVQNNKTLGINT